MIDMATGLSIAPPMPWSTRAAISMSRLGARPQSNEPSENTDRPI